MASNLGFEVKEIKAVTGRGLPGLRRGLQWALLWPGPLPSREIFPLGHKRSVPPYRQQIGTLVQPRLPVCVDRAEAGAVGTEPPACTLCRDLILGDGALL